MLAFIDPDLFYRSVFYFYFWSGGGWIKGGYHGDGRNDGSDLTGVVNLMTWSHVEKVQRQKREWKNMIIRVRAS